MKDNDRMNANNKSSYGPGTSEDQTIGRTKIEVSSHIQTMEQWFKQIQTLKGENKELNEKLKEAIKQKDQLIAGIAQKQKEIITRNDQKK